MGGAAIKKKERKKRIPYVSSNLQILAFSFYSCVCAGARELEKRVKGFLQARARAVGHVYSASRKGTTGGKCLNRKGDKEMSKRRTWEKINKTHINMKKSLQQSIALLEKKNPLSSVCCNILRFSSGVSSGSLAEFLGQNLQD